MYMHQHMCTCLYNTYTWPHAHTPTYTCTQGLPPSPIPICATVPLAAFILVQTTLPSTAGMWVKQVGISWCICQRLFITARAHVKCGDCASHSPPARRIFSHRRCSSACPQHSVRRPRPSRWAQVGKHHQCPAVPRATRGAGAEEGQQGGEPGCHPGRRSGEAPRTLQGPQAGKEVFALLPRSQGEEEVSRNLFTGSPWTPLSPTLPSPLTFFSLLSWNRAQRINCDP